MPLKLIVPLDGSSFSRQILPHLKRLFPPEAVAVQLLHVAEPIVSAEALSYPMTVGADYAFYTYGGVAGDSASRHPIYDSGELEDFRRGLEDDLRAEAEEFRRAGYNPTISVHFGSPANEIIRVVQERDSDLVAMVTHGRQGLGRLFAGSVAEEVVRELTVPVLLVNGADGEAPVSDKAR